MKGKVGCTTQLSQEFRNRAVAADQPEASIERPQIRERRRHAEPDSPGHAVVSEDNVGTRRLADMAGACDALAPIRSMADLQAAINRYLAEHNENPKPFVWKADPSRVLAAIERGKQALESVH